MGVRPYVDIVRLVWPLALGMVNNAVMQFVDRAYLANESMASLEAALPASILAFNVLGFFQSVVAYSGTFVAQYHGAGNGRMCRECLRVGTALSLAFGAAAVLFVPAGTWLLESLAAPPDVLSREVSYYGIVTAGGVFLFLHMAVSSYFTGRGRTRLVFWVNVLGNLLNAVLDPLLIFGLLGFPRLGMAGAAYATVASMAVQWGALTWFAARERTSGQDAPGAAAKAGAARLTFWPLAAKILRYGVPSGAYTVLNVLSFTIFVFVTGRAGDVAFAVSNACFSVNYMLFAPMEGFAVGAATLVGQDQGRGDGAAAHGNAMRVLLLGLAFVSVMSVLAVAFHRPILALFAPDAAVRQEFYSLGFRLFVLMAAWQVFDAADVMLSGALKGAGDTKFVMWWMVCAAFGLWLPLVWAVARWHNTMTALWGTMVVYVVVICIGTAARWFKGRWKEIKLV